MRRPRRLRSIPFSTRSLRLHIVARGKIGRGPEAELVYTYLKRIRWPVQVSELGANDPLPAADSGTTSIALDERGVALGSVQFADKLRHLRDDGVREARFLLGAADGLGDEVRASADMTISFGQATWPHLLVRAMLAEQLWRATSIIAGHPYHREG